MKTLHHTLKLAMIAIVLVCASCSKADSPTEDTTSMEEPTTQDLLMTGRWYMQSTSTGGAFNACERQSYLEFVDEDTLVIQPYFENGAMICVSDSVQVSSYVMSAENQFILANETDYPYTVDFISETQLILSQTDGVNSYSIHLSK